MTADLSLLVRLAAMAHKYEFESLLRWSLKKLDGHSAKISNQLISRLGDLGRRLLILSVQLQMSSLATRIEDSWIRDIRPSDLTQSQKVFEAALDVAELSPIYRQFHGKVYYAYLKAILKHNKSASIPAENPAVFINHVSSKLSRERTSRLYGGFWSLSQLQVRLSVPPQIRSEFSCSCHASPCVVAWKEWWNEKLRNLNPLPQDPGDLLQRIQILAARGIRRVNRSKNIDRHNSDNDYLDNQLPVVPCSSKMVAQLGEMMEIFYETLPDHFMIPLE